MDTGGEGFIFVSVDGSFNHDAFRNPIRFRFPDDDNKFIKELGLKLNRLAVGLAGVRRTWTPTRPGSRRPSGRA